jgi:MFS family permease
MHGVTYLLNTSLPLHVVALGGSLAQVGALFAVTTAKSMILRPLVGGLVDRVGPRAIMLPGALVLVATALALSIATTPSAFIVMMAGVGLSNGLVSTAGSIVVAAESPPARRGEALSLYYVASSAGVALGPAAGLALAEIGGMTLTFAVVTALAVVIAGLVASLRTSRPAVRPVTALRLRLWSRHALPVAAALILVTFGHGPVYAFLPLHAAAHGTGSVVWFFPLMSGFTVGCRLVLRRASDRIGRTRVLVPSMAGYALGYALLAPPPSMPSLVAAALVLGAATSMLYPTLVALVADRTPEAERGLAIGTASAAWDLGVATGSALIGVVVQATSYGVGFGTASVAAMLGLAAFVVTERFTILYLPDKRPLPASPTLAGNEGRSARTSERSQP